MGLSFGRIGLAVAGGLAEGASEAIDKRQERADKEIARRDALFQQAMRYADQDRDKYNAALKDKQEMLALARDEVSAMGLADDEQSQLVIAAGLVKQSKTQEALKNRLEGLREQYTIAPDVVKKGFAPLTSTLDKELLRSVTFDSLTEQLVSPSQRLKGLGSYYQPTPFESEGIFKKVGQKDIARQEAQFRQTADAFGLDKREVGEIPSLSGPIPYAQGIEKPMTADQLYARASAMEASGNSEGAAKLRKRADDLTAATDKSKGTVFGRGARIAAEARSNANSPYTFTQFDPAMQVVFNTSTAGSDELLKKTPTVGNTVSDETIYRYIATVTSFGEDDTNLEASLREIGFSAGQNVEQSQKFNNALLYRGNSSEDLNSFLKYLKNTPVDSQEFKDKNFPDATIRVAFALQNWDRMDENRKEESYTAMKSLLKNGFFINNRVSMGINMPSLYGLYVDVGNPVESETEKAAKRAKEAKARADKEKAEKEKKRRSRGRTGY